MDRDEELHCTDALRSLRTRARWKKIRAATLVFILFRRRVHHGGNGATTGKQLKQAKRMASSALFSKQQSQNTARTVGGVLLSAKPTSTVATSAPTTATATATASMLAASHNVWFTQKLHMLERLITKPIQNRKDVDIKLLGELIRHTKFFHGLTSASIDALAQKLRFRIYHEGEVLHRQGSSIEDTCARSLVISGSLLVYKNAVYAARAREGDDYGEWFVANTPGATRDTIKFGDCVDTCSTGDSCGDDAILGHLFREHTVIAQVKTVVAYVNQADYKRVLRFNLENESQVLETVREILTPAKPTKQELRQPKPKDQATTVHHPHAAATAFPPQQTRMLMRFLARFQCFRKLPYEFCLDLIPKLQLVVVKSDEVVCSSEDDKLSMVMVLDGKLCVHVNDNHESRCLNVLEGRRIENSYHRTKKPQAVEATGCLPGCEMSSETEATIGIKSMHLCSLVAGDSFGELVLSDTDAAHLQGASIYHPTATLGHPSTCTLVRLLRQDYEAAVQRYIETVDLNFETVCSMLSRSLPQDRTDEQIHYIKTFLLLRSSAKLFFSQIPSRVLESVLLHARVESHEIGEEIDDFIQRKDAPIDAMRVVLNGYVGVFKARAGVAAPTKQAEPAQETIAPKRAILKRYQSRLLRANTQKIDTSGAPTSGRRASIVKNAAPLVKPALVQLGEDSVADAGNTIEPVSVLPSGAAFGHLQILTGRNQSPHSYAAFASGSATGIGDDTTTVCGARVNLLSVPAKFVLLHVAALDELLIYNPVRTFKRLQHGSASLVRDGESTVPLVRGLHLPRLVAHNPAFRGIPSSLAATMIEEMTIVRVEPRRVIYEVGDPLRGIVFVVLSGCARAFNYVSRTKNRRGSFLPSPDDKRPKLSRRISQEPSQSKIFDANETPVDTEWYSFEKPAGDSIFLSDYSRTVELSTGDWFGRHGFIGTVHGNGRRPSNAAPTTPRRKSHAGTGAGGEGHGTYTESVVSMTDCLIGVVARRHRPCELTSEERHRLARMIQERDESIHDGESSPSDDHDRQALFTPTFNSLASSFQVLEAMGLAHRLSTRQRVQVANCLKHRVLSPGEIVYKQGEAGHAVYFVLFGSVTFFRKQDPATKDPSSRALSSSDPGTVFMDVMEGEVFGDEVFQNAHGDVRFCTAIANSDKDGRQTELLFLSRLDYDRIVDDSATVLTEPARQAGPKNDPALRLLGLGNRAITAKDRWKMAIFQVIQLRTRRSQWPTVLTKARDHRIDLVVDVIKDLPVFEGMALGAIKQFCGNAVLQTFAQDTIIFCKSDCIVDVCFLVVHGSVALHQAYYGSSTLSNSTGTTGNLTGYAQQAESTVVRVPIQTIHPGEIFGEFEILEDHPRRHINAVVSQPGTKLIVMQQDDFLAFWPKRELLERKLSVLKTQLRKPCRLDPDQLCSLYYAMKEHTFRRNEVMSGNKDQAGILHVIYDGMGVVHDAVVLQQKRIMSSSGKSRSPVKLSLDTRVSTLGPGSILFTDRHDKGQLSRRDSARGVENAETAAPVDQPKPTQYVVADSPKVYTYGVQLFPKRLSASQRTFQELLDVLLLGKGGLQVIRETVELQLKWRSDHVNQTGRLVANSLSQSAGNPGIEAAKSHVEAASSPTRPRLAKPTAPQDVSRVLVRRELVVGPADGASAQSPRKQVALSPYGSGSDGIAHLLSPRPTAAAIMGSFGSISTGTPSQRLSSSPRQASPGYSPTLPSLASISTVSANYFPSQSSPRHDNTKPPHSPSTADQLRREERVLASLPRPAPRPETTLAIQQQQMRRRHGRPPPKHVENKNKFVDEHAFSPVVSLKNEHDHKKNGLFRRLHHVKGGTALRDMAIQRMGIQCTAWHLSSYTPSFFKAKRTATPPSTFEFKALSTHLPPLQRSSPGNTKHPSAVRLAICCALGATTAETAPTEISVHIIERFEPLHTLTMVGAYQPVYEADGYRLMMSFKAFEYNTANAANETMECYFLDVEPDTWAPVKSTAENATKHNGEPAFCASRSVPEDETTFSVAMIKRVTNRSRKPLTGVLVHAVQGRGQKLLDEAKARGWPDVPLVTFRVTKFQRWRVAPMLTLVQQVQVTKADSKEQAVAQCPPDTHFLTDRKLYGGDYNAGVAGQQIWMLCVTFVQRSLHDLDPAESFYSTTRFRDRSIWRANTCGLHDHSVHFVDNGGWPIFRPRKGVQRLLCHDPQRLVKDLDSTKRLESTRQLVKSVHFDESFENRNERLRVDYHGNDAFAFPLQDIDMDAFNKF